MSIMNCYIERDRALVAVDTHAREPSGALRDMSKLLVIPHANTVLAGRGDVGYFSLVFNALLGSGAADFDAMPGAMSEALLQTERQYTQLLKSHDAGNVFAGFEIAMVGWSASLGRMQGVRYEKWPGEEFKRTTPIDPWSLSPNAGWDEVPNLPEGLEQASRDQVAMLRMLPCVAAGGRLIVAEVTKDAVSVRTACELA